MNRAATKLLKADTIELKMGMSPLAINSKDDWTLPELEHRTVVATGIFLPNEAVWLENRPKPIKDASGSGGGQSGFYVLMPLQLDGLNNAVLWVQRGWAPRSPEDRLQLPAIDTPGGLVTVKGVVIAQPDRVFELGVSEDQNSSGAKIKQNLELTKEASRRDWRQMPFVLRQTTGPTGDGLNRDWTSAARGVERHYAYAFQWFALALSAFLFWLIHGLLRMRQTTKR